jgi:transposase
MTAATHASVTLPTTVGLDLSDRVSHAHVLGGDGRTLETPKVAMRRDALSRLFERWKGCRLVIEAGGQSAWVSRLAESWGMEVVVANPRRVELISKSDRKSDRTDAQMLADLGRTNPQLLAPIKHRSAEVQAHLAVKRARDQAVRMRTSLINHVRCVLKLQGLRAPKSSPECFHKRVVLPRELEAALRPLVVLLSACHEQIKRYDREIERIGRDHYPIVSLLQQVPGVGPVVSLNFVLTLEDHRRFKSARDVGAYLGLVPRQKSSGECNPQLHITKTGDREMRRLLVVAANYILGAFGPDCDLRRFGKKIAGPGTDKRAKKRARVAVARKLAVLMHRLWRTGEVYDPLHAARKRGELVPA